MTTINWRRGLLRLWIACTLIWVTLAFFLIRPDHAYRHYQAAKNHQEDGEFKFRARREKPVALGSSEIGSSTKKIDIGDVPAPHKSGHFVPDVVPDPPQRPQVDISGLPVPPEDLPTLPDGAVRMSPEEWELTVLRSKDTQHAMDTFKNEAWTFAEVAFLPPLLALLLGLAGLWVLRGFKQPKAAATPSKKSD